MSEMVERVKRELEPLLRDGNIRLGVADEIARAIIATMREPTVAMVKCATRPWRDRKEEPPVFFGGVYKAMIDEALK